MTTILEIELPETLTTEMITQVLSLRGGYSPTKEMIKNHEEIFDTLEEANARVLELDKDETMRVLGYGPPTDGKFHVVYQETQQIQNMPPEEFAIKYIEGKIREMFAVAAEEIAELQIEETVVEAKKTARAAARASVQGGKARFKQVS